MIRSRILIFSPSCFQEKYKIHPLVMKITKQVNKHPLFFFVNKEEILC